MVRAGVRVPNKVTQTYSCGAGRRGVRQRPADVMVSWVSNGRRISKPFSAGYCKLFIDTRVNLELGAPAGVSGSEFALRRRTDYQFSPNWLSGAEDELSQPRFR